MAEVSAKSFLSLLNKSGLCELDDLKASLGELSRKTKGRSVNLGQLTEHLLESGMISEWHVKKLMTGRYKGFFLGKYKLLRHLGTGGMSTVYMAENTLFKQERAIKVLPRQRISDKTYLERFYREGRAAASLNHKNIVRVYDIDHEDDTHYLVMEFVAGRDISDMVKKSGPLSYANAIEYTLQAVIGLQHAHENDLVHRDIKPANLLVTPAGVLKILDLGLALFREEDTSLTVMHNERVLGTADYISPEQAVDSHNVDHRSDIYSLGCTLYFMLTGKPPFHMGTIAQRIAMHQTKQPEDVRKYRKDCPNEVLELLHRMTQKKPDDRYADCHELARHVRQVAESLDGYQSAGHHFDVPKKIERPAPINSDSKRAVAKGSSGGSSGRLTNPRSAVQKLNAQRAEARNKRVQQASQSGNGPSGSGSAKAKSASEQVAKPTATRKPGQADKPTGVAGSQPSGQATRKQQSPVKTRGRSKQESSGSSKQQNQVAKKVTQKQAIQIPPVDVAPPAPSNPSANAKPRPSLPGSPELDPTQTILAPAEFSINIDDDAAVAKPGVGTNELRQFAKQTRLPGTNSVLHRSKKSSKNNWILAGVVIGMLLLLGIVLAVAMRFAKKSTPKAALPVTPVIIQVDASQQIASVRPEFFGMEAEG